MGRPVTTILSRATIAQAALDIIDEAGTPALTMRALADRFGVQGASLYNHIASKDDLLEAVAELINRQIDVRPLRDADWQRGVAEYARSYRAVYRAHPNMIAIVARAPVASAEALAGYDALLAVLRRAGCTLADAAAASAALDYLVLGSALETFTVGFDRTPAHYRPDYPNLAAALEASTTSTPGSSTLDDCGFELGLEMLLAGLARRIAAPR